jgi:hypothetical protein
LVEGREAAAGEVGFESFVYELGRGNGEAAHRLEKGKRSRRVAETFFS